MHATKHRLIEVLLNPDIYPFPCTHVEVVETHISWVFLTGLRAYKIKKPVDLGFVDFTTLERRRFFCEEELRLNRRLAPDLYLEVVPITGSFEYPELNGTGPVIEYAVCMVQFDQQQLLSRLPLEPLQPQLIERLADDCASFHALAEVASVKTRYGDTDVVAAAMRKNFEVMREATAHQTQNLSQVETYVETELQRLQSVFTERKSQGMIRECHGDLHLGNMFVNGDAITVFDGIEFNDEFRWIDIMTDIAFTVMDFKDRQHFDLANHFLNRWLERTGDYQGLAVLPLYCAYRACVRAKVAVLRMQQADLSESEQSETLKEFQEYLSLAKSFSTRQQQYLLITTGPSGSGKTTITQRLIKTLNLIRVRSDVERKRLFGLALEETSSEILKQTMYSAQATSQTYDRLAELTTQALDAGFPVVVDATFLKYSERNRFSQLAEEHGVPFLIIECQANVEVLKERITQRQLTSNDASEANPTVLMAQLDSVEELTNDEQAHTIQSDTQDLCDVILKRTRQSDLHAK